MNSRSDDEIIAQLEAANHIAGKLLAIGVVLLCSPL